jgi:SAM-dependent methyltransferase
MTPVADLSPPANVLKADAPLPIGQRVKRMLYPLYCALTGRGGGFLRHKQEVHRRRGIAERRVLEEAKSDPSLFRQNACPACGERLLPREEFANPIGFQFAVCPADGTVYMDPIPTDASLTRMYNDPAESYLWLREEESAEVEVAATDSADYRALLRWIPVNHQGMRLLDVGCATGGFLLSARQTFEAEGCELNDATAATARAQGLNVRTARIQDVPGEDLFDVITMLQVIEHLPTPAESLRHVYRLLKPTGYFYLNTPNIDSASFKLLSNRHTHVSSFGHVSLFNKQSLSRLAERCQFEVVRYEYCGGSDVALHDWLSYRFARPQFVHRMALYSTRFYFSAMCLDKLTLGGLSKLILPTGHESYHRALLRVQKPNSSSSNLN